MATSSGRPQLAGNRMSPFWILLLLRVMEVVVTTGAIKHAKLQSKCHCHQTNTQFFYRPDALPVTQPTVSKQCEAFIALIQLVWCQGVTNNLAAATAEGFTGRTWGCQPYLVTAEVRQLNKNETEQETKLNTANTKTFDLFFLTCLCVW